MKNIRPFLIVLGLLIVIPIAVEATIQQQRAQIGISLTINVTPYVGFNPPPPGGQAAVSASGILASTTLNERERPNRYTAESLVFDDNKTYAKVVAANQKPVQVQAEVSPNPNGTLLYGNNCQGNPGICSSATVTQAAGTKVVYPCIYQVVVDSTQPSWTLDSGLYTDFEPQGSGSGIIPGGDVGYNGYLSTPKPTATPFIVYSDGVNWTTFAANALMKTYCVDLTITIPQTTVVGTYGSQAVYTLYF
ncbi:MAG: hypothetical protein JOY98_03100 [Candidatus Eremiobacteraeota bacterium]|nr:hypothetical protein [Candidatus Eremiobacteraeota bacterium]